MNSFDTIPLSANQADKIRKQLRPLDSLARDAQAQIDCLMAEMREGWITMPWEQRREHIIQAGLWHAYEATDQLTHLYDMFSLASRANDAAEECPVTASDLKRVLHNFQAQLGNRLFTERFGDKFQLSPARISSILRAAEPQFMPQGGNTPHALHRHN